jgi:hypothetical protein
MRHAAALLILCSTLPAHAADRSREVAPDTMIGFKLGAPLGLPQCASETKYRHLSYTRPYAGQNASGCWRHTYLGPKPGEPLQQTEKVWVTISEAPAGFDRDDIELLVVNGNVEGITISTLGLNAQTSVYDALHSKYGEPTDLQETTTQNRMGATFPLTNATWTFSNLTVVFLGMGSTIDTGYVVVDTPIAAAHKEAERARKAAEAPTL